MVRFPAKKSIDLYIKSVSPEQMRLDLSAAQQYMFDAWEADELETVLKLIRKALKKSPLCADAYTFYCEIIDEPPIIKLGYLESGLHVATVALGEDVELFSGSFWGFLETRPFMRAKAALADTHWQLGHFDQAMTHYREMLQLNPADNQGIRYLLASCYLELEMVDELTRLLEDYAEDSSPALQYSRALLAYRKGASEANGVAKMAISANRYVAGLLEKRRLPPKSFAGYITPGQPDEAMDYVASNLKPWIRTPGAIAWIVELTAVDGG